MKKIFIGSSSEKKELAEEVASWIQSPELTPIVWSSTETFKVGGNIWEELNEKSHEVDGAIFIFGDDDVVISRDTKSKAVRDNVILEYGLFAGSLSSKNVCFAIDGKVKKLPSDLSGVIYANISNESQYEGKKKIKDWINGLQPVNNKASTFELKDDLLKAACIRKNKQEEIIDKILSQFCELIKEKAGLKDDIEAVVVLFCRNNNNRMTFYSCNKGDQQDRHREKDLYVGVVGILIEKYEDKPRDFIVYYDKKMGAYYEIRNLNRKKQEFTEKWKEGTENERSWSKSDTNSMLAIPFSVEDKLKNHTIIGALTFDLSDSLFKENDNGSKVEIDKEKIDDLCSGIVATRNAIELLLTNNIEMDFLEYGLSLDKLPVKKKNNKGNRTTKVNQPIKKKK